MNSDVTSFLGKVSDDGELKKELQSLLSARDEEGILGLARQHGFQLEPEGLVEIVTTELAKLTAGELSDHELEAVAGGSNPLEWDVVRPLVG